MVELCNPYHSDSFFALSQLSTPASMVVWSCARLEGRTHQRKEVSSANFGPNPCDPKRDTTHEGLFRYASLPSFYHAPIDSRFPGYHHATSTLIDSTLTFGNSIVRVTIRRRSVRRRLHRRRTVVQHMLDETAVAKVRSTTVVYDYVSNQLSI